LSGERPRLMAELPAGSGPLLRRAVDANLRYYEALGELSLDYLRVLRTLAGKAAQADPVGFPVAAPAAPAAQAPTLVLESEAGGTGIGAFLVQNLLDERISAPVNVSAFVAPDGREASVAVSLDPEVVTLEPGEQMLVRAGVRVDGDLEAGVGYRGEISVPGLTGTRVPVVVRRRDAPPTP
jgi:hypothetical protein